jgi:hypothetical protein
MHSFWFGSLLKTHVITRIKDNVYNVNEISVCLTRSVYFFVPIVAGVNHLVQHCSICRHDHNLDVWM